MELSLEIRRAVKADAPDIFNILKDSFGQYIQKSGIPLPLGDMLGDIASIERDIETIDVFIAFFCGAPAGTVRVCVPGAAPPQTSASAPGAAPPHAPACAPGATPPQTPASAPGATPPQTPAQLTKLGVMTRYNNLGIGKLLMKFVDRVIIDKGAKSLELYTASKNADIMRFYYSLGFYADSTTRDRGYIRALMRKDYA